MAIFDRSEFLPFLGGVCLISVNFALLGLLWHRVLEKKPVAITIGLVVIKYAILAAVLYVLVKEWKLPLLPLFAGLTTIGVSFVLAALQSQLGTAGRE
jgi:CHASE2 domain-containing sensor protein